MWSRVFGLDVELESDLLLPDLVNQTLPRPGSHARVKVETGIVRSRGDVLWTGDFPSHFSCLRHGATIFLNWPTVRFSVEPHRVVIDAHDLSVASEFLVPAAWSVVLAAKGRECLHGCTVERQGKALAVLGNSGTGKSTAALGLIDRGWRLITDDLLTFDEKGDALPGPRYARLGSERAAGRHGIPSTGGKVRIQVPSCPEATPLAAIVVLSDTWSQTVRLTGVEAASAILDHPYNPMLTHPGQSRRRFDLALALAERVPVYGAVPRSLTPGDLEELAQGSS